MKKFVSLCLALWAAPLTARPDGYKVNVREACRRDVAGAYLEAYDAKERTADYAKALAAQVAGLDQALTAARTRLAKARAAADAHAFDADRAFAVDRAAAEQRALEDQRTESAAAQSAAAAKLAALQAAEATLRKSVETVFTLTRAGEKQDGGYPFQIDYRASCPKYRYVCALPREDAERLAKLEIGGAVPVACQRYAGLSQIR